MTTKDNRPLSPHLQVYRLPFTGILSITHRVTGVLLSFGLIGVVYILAAIAGGVETYQTMQTTLGLWPLQLVYWGFLYALCFHLCHGIRHLIWDSGRSFDKKTMNYHASIELLGSVLLILGIVLLT